MENNPYKQSQRQPFDPDALPKDFASDFATWKDSAFQVRGLGEVASVWEETVTNPKTLNFLGYAASMSSAGYWPAIRWLVQNRFIDVLVSTGANLTEDIYEAMHQTYWKVDPWFPDDEDLLKNKMDRFYDHAADEVEYRKMEMEIIHFIKELNKKLTERTIFPTWRLLYEFGKWLSAKGIKSILAVAAENNIPVFSPALVDSGFGEAYVWALSDIPRKDRKLVVEQFYDEEDIFRIAEWGLNNGLEKTAGYIGGGVPKDFTQLVAVSQALVRPTRPGEEELLEGGIDDAVYPYKFSFQITTDSPQWGGLSGCGVMTEPISWGKQAGGGRNAQVFTDATIALRLILRYFKEKGIKRNGPPDLSWVFKQQPEVF
ncbi:MAG TPA: deoxyhypusine synthase [Candidatus Kerfeldbacteria bacterium]|nr:deoxyhypusine synthase [Candidatus Kerfeldbacteria bacterium]